MIKRASIISVIKPYMLLISIFVLFALPIAIGGFQWTYDYMSKEDFLYHDSKVIGMGVSEENTNLGGQSAMYVFYYDGYKFYSYPTQKLPLFPYKDFWKDGNNISHKFYDITYSDLYKLNKTGSYNGVEYFGDEQGNIFAKKVGKEAEKVYTIHNQTDIYVRGIAFANGRVYVSTYSCVYSFGGIV